MNLVSQPWIRVIDENGQLAELSLAETLTHAHHLACIHGQTPLERVALFRMLLAVAYRVSQPATEAEAIRLHRDGQFDASRVQAYLRKGEHCLRLYDARHPFYQVANPPDGIQPSNINRLFLHYSTGIKGTVHSYIHDGTQLNMTPAQAAHAVVTAQAFLTAGGSSGRPGIMYHHTPPLQQSNLILQAPTLFDTLWLHLFPKDSTRELAPFFPDASPSPDDCPVWERDHPEHPPRSRPQGPLDVLTYPSRLIKLLPDDSGIVNQALFTQGVWIEPNVPRFDPLAAYRSVTNKAGSVSIWPVKADCIATDMLRLLDLSDNTLRWPAFARWHKLVAEQALPPDGVLFTSVGVECDPRNVASVRRLYDYWLPVPSAWLLDEGHVALLRKHAESLKTWSFIAAEAIAAAIQSLPPSRKERLSGLSDLIQHQLHRELEDWLPLVVSGREPPDWQAITKHLLRDETQNLPAAARAAAYNTFNRLSTWQDRKGEAYAASDGTET